MVFHITKNELRNLFYSPISWFVMILILVLCSVSYGYMIEAIAEAQESSIHRNPNWSGFNNMHGTLFVFSGSHPDSVFNLVVSKLLFLFPLLSMTIISREFNNGTHGLLYSSPIKLWQLVLGKYLGIVLFAFLLVLIISVTFIAAGLNADNVDYGLLFTAALGYFLMCCTFAAIGMFMSSLTSYYIISAILTLITLVIFSRLGELWQDVDIVRDITYSISLIGVIDKFLFGLITTKDVAYYLIVISMFVLLTIFRLQSNRNAQHWSKSAIKYVSVIMVGLGLGYVTSRPKLIGYWDNTQVKISTIDSKAQVALKRLNKGPLEVTLYTNLMDDYVDYGMPATRNAGYLDKFWSKYQRFKRDIDFKYEYYYDYNPVYDNLTLAPAKNYFIDKYPGKSLKEIAIEKAAARDFDIDMFKTPEEMRKQIDLDPEGYSLVMKLKYDGRTATLRTFKSQGVWPKEDKIIVAVNQLVDGYHPKLAFVTGHLERSVFKTGEREYTEHTRYLASPHTLVNLGFTVDSLSLEKDSIPSDLAALVLADPKVELSETEFAKLERYIENGGNMIITGEPGKQQVLNPLLQKLGVQLMSGQLLQPSEDETADKIRCQLPGIHEDITFLMDGATGISYNNEGQFKITPMAKTRAGKTWISRSKNVFDSIAPVFRPELGDIDSSMSTLVLLTREKNGREQRILVAGDADFLSNDDIGKSLSHLVPGIYHSMTDGRNDIQIGRRESIDNKLSISLATAQVQKIIMVWILPSLMLLLGTVILVRRKRK